jgi:PPP family 3-phenylpropionic acid transporter
VIRLAAFYFAYFFALGAFSPYFASWLEVGGAAPWQISVVMSLWYGTRMFAPSLWAYGASRYGNPATWLRIGCLLTLLSFGLFLLPWSFAALLLVMLLFTSFYNAVMPQFEAITLEHLGDQRMRYPRIRLWGSVGFLLANLGYGAALKAFGYECLIGLLLPAFALLALAAWTAPSSTNRRAVATTTRSGPIRNAPLSGTVRRLLLIAFLMQVTHGPLYIYLSLFLAEHGWDAAQIGQFWALGVLAEVALFFFMPRVLSRFTPVSMLGVCLAAGAVRWPLLAFYPESAWLVGAAQVLHALTFAAFHVCVMQLISQDTRGAELQRVQALLYGLGSGAGGVLGALLAGAVWRWLGHAEAFVLAGVLSLLGIFLLPALRRTTAELRHA